MSGRGVGCVDRGLGMIAGFTLFYCIVGTNAPLPDSHSGQIRARKTANLSSAQTQESDQDTLLL
jgi:hypothetical protein